MSLGIRASFSHETPTEKSWCQRPIRGLTFVLNYSRGKRGGGDQIKLASCWFSLELGSENRLIVLLPIPTCMYKNIYHINVILF